MRRKKLLRQVAAAAVALSMAASLSAPAFAAVVTFNLSDGGLVITANANESGITVTQDGKASSTYDADTEIEITGTYNSAGGAALTAEENQQDENQPVTPAKAPAKAPAKEETSEETPKETQEAEDAPAAEEKQKDTEDPADPEQKTETENKDKNNDPADEEKKEQNASAEGEEQPKPKAEAKAEAKASAEATASASDDTSANTSNGPRKASARSSGEGERSSEGERRGIIQIFANTLVKLKLKDATIDQPHASDTTTRGMAAIDIQGSGDVEIKVEGNNTLNGSGNSAGIQKNDDVSTGKLTITAKDKDQTLNVNADVRGAAIGGSGWGWNEGSNSQHGTKNIEINGGTVNTQGRIGSGYKGGAAENIVITGDAVVNANGGIGGGTDEGYEGNEGRQTSITISGNAQVNATYKVDTGSDYGYKYGFGGSDAGLAVIGGGVGSSSKKSHAKVTIQGNAQVTAENRAYGGGAGIGGGANGTGEVIIGGKAQVKATGSAEHHGSWENNGAGAAIGDGGTTAGSSGSVQNGENKFTTDKSIQDGAKVEMTNIGHNGSNTVTQTRQNGEWVTKCSNHEFVETTVAPTCTESGYTVQKCSVCGEETGERTNIVAPLGHEYKNGVCIRCGAPEPQENGSAAPNYTVTGAETYETSVVDGRYIIAVPSEDAALSAVLGDLRAIKAQGADVVVFRTRSRESSLVIDEMLAMGTDVTPFVLAHNGGEARLTINGAAHNELIH